MLPSARHAVLITLATQRGDSVIHVVVQKLTPLHYHVAVEMIWSNVCSADQGAGHQSRAWFLKSKILLTNSPA